MIGQGNSRKKAEQHAAQLLIQHLRNAPSPNDDTLVRKLLYSADMKSEYSN